jgi:hypothetical protein
VTVIDEELRSPDPEVSRSIDIVEFAALAHADPVIVFCALAAKAYPSLTG